MPSHSDPRQQKGLLFLFIIVRFPPSLYFILPFPPPSIRTPINSPPHASSTPLLPSPFFFSLCYLPFLLIHLHFFNLFVVFLLPVLILKKTRSSGKN
jgi:hypothetical protein